MTPDREQTMAKARRRHARKHSTRTCSRLEKAQHVAAAATKTVAMAVTTAAGFLKEAAGLLK